ncbi:MAG: 1,4-alpha-glucan branching protein GlgB [Cryomorphaceae bacterium]|nr:1,4-alpha-glucan branching protein GlgB [Flavobacteriales bacterium]
MADNKIIAHSLFTEFDTSLFGSGKHFKLYEKMGSTPMEVDGKAGTYFAVWAPNAESVSVIGSFNNWSKTAHPLNARWDHSGIWEGFIPGAGDGDTYKYAVKVRGGSGYLEKGDPYAIQWETPPKTASVIRKTDIQWSDGTWMKNRKKKNALDAPMSVYEVHLGSWKRKPEDNNRSLTYREMADELVPYIKQMGFTHVEMMPVMEHPFFGSWGYQITGYFAPSSRFGTPEDFAFLVNAFHKAGIGVIIDWVPSHFPGDLHGLFRFDGTSLYEHEDYRLGYHPDWKSFIFNYGRHEVRAFLISNALYWLDKFHIDGIRVDAVASMLYLDYSRKEGEWIPNRHGGRENLEAVSLLKEMNEAVYAEFPDVQTIAEESTSWPMVSRPVSSGGLGFGLKWMMGWMNDVLEYVKENPIYRQFHQNKLTFSLVYAFNENFMLPLSHDEVVHGKGSLLSRMPGDEWQRFANIRALYAWMYTHPGAKLMFMGSEFAQFSEWKHDESLLWNLHNFELHSGISELVTDLNELYKSEKALYENSFSQDGFEWIDYGDTKNSVVTFYRKGKTKGKKKAEKLLVVGNFTPVSHDRYRVGVDETGGFEEIFNSDALRYGGSGVENATKVKTEKTPSHGRPRSVEIKVPPLGFTVLRPVK